MESLFTVGSEDFQKDYRDQQIRSSAPLFLSHTNESIHSSIVNEYQHSIESAVKLEETVREQCENFIIDYARKESAFVPYDILHGYITEQLVLYENKEPIIPFFPAADDQGSLETSLWESFLRKLDPATTQEIYDVPLKKGAGDLINNDLSKFKFLFEGELEWEDIPSTLDENVWTKSVPSKPWLPCNIMETPIKPPTAQRGSSLQTFHSSSGSLFILHAGGPFMSDLHLSKFIDHGVATKKITTFPCPEKVNGNIYQIEIRNTRNVGEVPQRIALRYRSHCIIVDLVGSENDFKFSIVECLYIPDVTMDISVCRYSGNVFFWGDHGSLFLWSNGKLRTLYKRIVPHIMYDRFESAHELTGSYTAFVSKSLPYYNRMLCTATSHPHVSIHTESDSIFSCDFRESISFQRPLYIINPPHKAAQKEIMGLSYHFDDPFHFAVNTRSTVFLFDERYTAKPLKEWAHLVIRDPCRNLQFLGRSTECYSCDKDMVVSWTASGKTLLHPFALGTKNWNQNLLSQHTPSDLPYLVPGFQINENSSYKGWLNTRHLQYKQQTKLRWKKQLETIGQSACWLNSIESSASKQPDDQLVLIQLSRLGDIYSESFDFNVTPSFLSLSNDLWFDSKGHKNAGVLERETVRQEEVSPFYFWVVNSIPFLHQVIEKSQLWNRTPKGFQLFLKDNVTPLPFVEQKDDDIMDVDEEKEKEPSFNEDAYYVSLKKFLQSPQTLYSIWRKSVDIVPSWTLRDCYEWIVGYSTLLYSLSFPGDQTIGLLANPMFSFLVESLKKKKAGAPILFYTWTVRCKGIDTEKLKKESQAEAESQELDEEEEEEDFLSPWGLASFSLYFVCIQDWDDAFDENFETVHADMSSLHVRQKKKKALVLSSRDPKEYDNLGIMKMNQPNVTPVMKEDYEIDFERMLSDWNLTMPKDVEKVIGSSYSTFKSNNSQSQSQSQSIQTGSAAIQRFSQSQQATESGDSMVASPRPPIRGPQSSQSSQRSRVKDSQDIAPSQDDVSMLFSLLGGSDSE